VVVDAAVNPFGEIKISSHSPITEIPEDNHWWFATRTWSLLNLLDKNFPTRNGAVLDLGCGAGNMMHHLSRYGRVRGIDIDPRPVAAAQARGYDAQQGDPSRGTPFPAASFDLVTALDVIEHVEDDEAILREAHRLLQPHGILCITTPAFQWLWSHNDEINAHKRRYSTRELREKIERAGFRIRRLSFGFFLVFPLSAPMIVLRNSLGQKQQLRSHILHDDEYQVEMEPTAPWLNTILRGVGRLEAALVSRLNLPIGSSLTCIAEKI
jgi:SAM-dependent methyltransferase